MFSKDMLKAEVSKSWLTYGLTFFFCFLSVDCSPSNKYSLGSTNCTYRVFMWKSVEPKHPDKPHVLLGELGVSPEIRRGSKFSV